jgi:hypothetical protein
VNLETELVRAQPQQQVAIREEVVRATATRAAHVARLDEIADFNTQLKRWLIGMIGVMNQFINEVALADRLMLQRGAENFMQLAKQRVAESEAQMVRIVQNIIGVAQNQQAYLRGAQLTAQLNEASRNAALVENSAIKQENLTLREKLDAATSDMSYAVVPPLPTGGSASGPGRTPVGRPPAGKPPRSTPTNKIQRQRDKLGRRPPATDFAQAPVAEPDVYVPPPIPPPTPFYPPPVASLTNTDMSGPPPAPPRPLGPNDRPVFPGAYTRDILNQLERGVQTRAPAMSGTAMVMNLAAKVRDMNAAKAEIAQAKANSAKWGALIPSNKNYNPVLAQVLQTNPLAADAFALGGASTTTKRRRRTVRKRKVSRRR